MSTSDKKPSALELLAQLDRLEVRARIQELQKELDALKVIQKALDVRENGSPKRGGGGTGKRGKLDERRAAVHDYLQANGSATAATIAEALDIPKGSIHSVLDCEWFEKWSDGSYQIARASA